MKSVDLFGNPILGRSHRHHVSRGILDGIYGPRVRWFSGGGGGSKQKSSSESGTRWNGDFMEQLMQQSPGINYSNTQDGVSVANPGDRPQQFTLGVPKFQGLENMDFAKLEKGLYDRQLQNIEPQYQKARAQTREELSQSGLLNSPVQYGQGGAMDNLQRNYLDETQKAATGASNTTIALKQQELARKTGFDVDLVKLFQTILGQYANMALEAGKFGQQSSSGTASNFNFGVLNNEAGGAAAGAMFA